MTLQAFRSNEDTPRRQGAWNGIRRKAYMRMGVVLEAVKGRDIKRAVLAASTRCDQLDLSFDFDQRPRGAPA